ncbi:MAG: PAS domain-containing protein [Myxococcales bacterium]|nr:PAS domain-containing protein [Myxococcales bacterium]
MLDAALLITILASALCGAFVLRRNASSPIHRQYALMMFALTGWSTCMFMAVGLEHPGFALFNWPDLGAAFASMIIAGLVHFSHLYPTPGSAAAYQGPLAYMVGLVLAVFSVMGAYWDPTVVVDGSTVHAGYRYKPLFALFVAWVVGGASYAAWRLRRKLAMASSPDQRIELKVALIGIIVATAIATTTAVALPLLTGDYALLPWAPVAVLIGIGAGTGYGVVRLDLVPISRAIERFRVISVTRKIILSGLLMAALVMSTLLPFTGRLVGIEGSAAWTKYFMYTLLSVILITLPTLLYMIRIVSTPLGELTEAAWSLSRGNVARRVTINSDDEMGVLASAFNIMAANLERDINELKRLNVAIADEKNLTQNVLDSINLAIVVVDMEGHVLEWNRTMAQWWKIPREDALAKRIYDDLLPQVRNTLITDDLFEGLREDGGPVRHYNRPFERDGVLYYLNLTLVALRNQEGERYGTMCIMEDVTEMRSIEAELIQSAKLASVGVLASGIVHEVNNPLASISSLLQFMREEEQEPERRGSFQTMIDQINRVATTLQGVVDFARQRPAEKRPLDLARLVAETAKFISFDKRFNGIRIREHYAPGLPRVHADSDKIQQVLMNLMFNAADAMPDGGDLTLGVSAADDGRSVVLEVADSGMGIHDDVIEKIFDPFFTTKPTGRGTGLGLSVCHGIIRAHGGSIHVLSQPGEGTTFRVVLPVQSADEGDGTAPPETPGGAESEDVLSWGLKNKGASES